MAVTSGNPARRFTAEQTAALRRLALRRELLGFRPLAMDPSALEAILLDLALHQARDRETLAQLIGRGIFA